eukprot:684892-Prorocentrum_minimum.AAC.1
MGSILTNQGVHTNQHQQRATVYCRDRKTSRQNKSAKQVGKTRPAHVRPASWVLGLEVRTCVLGLEGVQRGSRGDLSIKFRRP